VPSERLLLLMAREIIVADAANAAVVLEEEASPPVASWIAQLGCGIVRSHARRAAMDGAMREHGAVLGGGPSGQIWHLVTGQPLPDALWTITRLLVLLSRSDRPLSQVLDVDAAMH
jgi:phosphomannomutase